MEAGERIVPAFFRKLSARAARDLESLGIQVWTLRKVTGVDRKPRTLPVANEKEHMEP